MGRGAGPGLTRLLAFGGVLAPLVFPGAVIVTAAGRPEYHHATQAISELGEVGARNAALMNYGGFLLYGLLIVGLAVGLHQGIRRGSGDWLGPLLFLIYGLAYMGGIRALQPWLHGFESGNQRAGPLPAFPHHHSYRGGHATGTLPSAGQGSCMGVSQPSAGGTPHDRVSPVPASGAGAHIRMATAGVCWVHTGLDSGSRHTPRAGDGQRAI